VRSRIRIEHRSRRWQIGGVKRASTCSHEPHRVGAPETMADGDLPPDATKSKDGDLEAKLAARRQWEGGGDSASAAEPAPAKDTPAKSTPSPPAKSAQDASAPGAAGGCWRPGDLAASLAARRMSLLRFPWLFPIRNPFELRGLCRHSDFGPRTCGRSINHFFVEVLPFQGVAYKLRGLYRHSYFVRSTSDGSCIQDHDHERIATHVVNRPTAV